MNILSDIGKLFTTWFAQQSTIDTPDSGHLAVANKSDNLIIKKSDGSEIIIGGAFIRWKIPFWYNSINEQTGEYLFDEAHNELMRDLMRIDDGEDGDAGKTYKIDKASVFVKDPESQAATNPVVALYKNDTDIMTSNVTIPLTTDANKVTGFDTKLTPNIDGTKNSLSHGDLVNVKVITGTGTDKSQIQGYVLIIIKEA